MRSKFFFSLDSIKAQYSSDGGSITCVTSKEAPGFVNISFVSLKLKSKGFLEPIWHPNAHKIGHCLQGRALVSIRNPAGVDTFTVEKGDVFFIQQGYIHTIQNISTDEIIINFALNHTDPEIMRFANAIYSLSDNVFGATFNSASSEFLSGLKKTKNQDMIGILPSMKPSSESIPSEFKFNVDNSSKPVQTKGGFLQLAVKANLPALDGLGILRFGLNVKGNVEPHWHTNAGELVYIVKGKTRITVLDPAGNVEVLEVNGGQGAFAPASHFHNIENIGAEEVEVIAYFTHASPDYIGIGEVAGSYSNELLAATFNVASNYFDAFKKPEKPLIIVPI